MANPVNIYDFFYNSHSVYNKYYDAWRLNVNSFYGGEDYKQGEYLKAYDIDYSTPSEVISTYGVDENGNQTAVYRSPLAQAQTPQSANQGGTQYNNNFYGEKLDNVPVYPWVRLVASEYNAILFRNPPSRQLIDDNKLPVRDESINDFIKDVDGEGNSVNEFMSMVDTFSTVYGVVWVSCLKGKDGPYPRWRMHSPLDVTNWKYRWNESNNLELENILIRVAQEDNFQVFQHITKETIETLYVPYETDDYSFDYVDFPEGTEFITEDEDDKGFYRHIQVNELGYIPVRPIYQSTKIQNGVGHTPIFDIAQIQRSVYADMGEIYSAVSYGSHPVNIVDTETLQANGDSIGAEPGSVVRVANSLNGQPNYVYEFVAPPLDSIAELRQLIDQKIDKMNQVAMIRSEDLIKASRSGVQIEQYDSKLEALIRKKATSLENAEYQLWRMWFDWEGHPMPEEFAISYNRHFNVKSLENELAEIDKLLLSYERFDKVFSHDMSNQDFAIQEYATEAEAESIANKMGGSGTHSHEKEDGSVIYMPFATHDEYDAAVEAIKAEHETDPMFKQDIKQKIKERLGQIAMNSSTNNSL